MELDTQLWLARDVFGLDDVELRPPVERLIAKLDSLIRSKRAVRDEESSL